MARKRIARKRTKTGPIKPIQLGIFSQDAMRAYGSYVLMDRAVADVRDGLKPVQRRILWAMHELRLLNGFKKSAKIVGDCLAAGTLVRTSRGLIPIEEVSSQDLGCLSLSTLDGVATVAEAFSKGERDTIRVSVRRGYGFTSTPDHRVLVLSSDSKLVWRPTGTLCLGDHLVLRQRLDEKEYPSQEVHLDFVQSKGSIQIATPPTVSRQLSSLLGFLVAEGSLGSKLCFGTCSSKLNNKFASQWLGVFSEDIPVSSWREVVDNYTIPLREYRNGRYGVLEFFEHLGFVGTAATKRVPWSVLQSPRAHIIDFLASYWDGDGYSSCKKAVAVSASRLLLEDIQVLLLEFGIQSQLGKFKPSDKRYLNGRKILTKGAWTLNIHQVSRFFQLIGSRSLRHAKECTVKYWSGLADLVPHIHVLYREAVSKYHLGGGWYRCHDGSKQRLVSGSKISSRFRRPGLYRSFIRDYALPFLDKVDPCLASQLRLLSRSSVVYLPITSIEKAGRRFVFDIGVARDHNFLANGIVVHNCMGNYHPHGDSAIYQTMVNMVWDRYPLIEGHGNFGSPTDNAASMRYTEAKLSPLAAAMFEDIDVAELVSNYSDDRKEPLVLPSRLPLLLLNGSTGIGVGLRATIPPHNLRELVRCLIYFVRKDHPRLSTVMKNMPGPDYGHGVLLSSAEEVRSLYETGKGTLHFRCEYSYEDGPVLVVTSLSPGFNMSTFLSKMRKLSEEGLIEFCSDASSADGIRIYVGFKDPAVLKDRVLSELHTSQSYQFYVVKRDDETGLSKDTLFSDGLFRMFGEFINFRRGVEEARLRRNLLLAKAALLKAKAILTAVHQLDTVYRVLKEKHADLTSLRKTLAVSLDLSDKQAQVVLDMPVHRLARMNSDAQKEKIQSIKTTIDDIKADLGDIDGVVVNHLKNLLQFADARGTKLASEVEAPVLAVESTLTWVMAQGSKLTRLADEPSRRNKFDHVASGSSIITAVYANNNAEVLATSYLTEHSVSTPVVGLVSGEAQLIVALDDVGRVVVLKHPPGKKTTFNVMRDATKLVAAVGVYADGYLALVSAGGKGRVLHASDLKGTRAFVRGFKLYPTAEHGSRRLVVTQLFSLPYGAELYNSKGRCLSCKDEEYFDARGSVFAIGERNFVSVKTGKRDILDGDATINLLRCGELTGCWILD